MRQEAQFHIHEAQKQLRLALKYASEFDDCNQLSKMTEILGYFDSWITDKPKIKHELNNTKFKWNNEYRFVPATQKQESVVLCDGYSVKNDES
jgi:hypothetical protein